MKREKKNNRGREKERDCERSQSQLEVNRQKIRAEFKCNRTKTRESKI